MLSWQKNLIITGLTILHTLPVVDAVEVSPNVFSKGLFDFVIVGGGSAGLALATRLSEDAKVKVGVIEAGVVRLDNKILIPGLQTLGNPGWTFNVMQDNIKKSENWTAPSHIIQEKYFANNDPENHGTRGPVKDSAYSFYADVVTPFFQAAQALNISINKAMGYYVPNAHRANLVVVTGVQVTKILTKISRGLVSATQVEYISENETYTVTVGKEVILSAGTIQTPQILELSGIGNKTLLNTLSIPVVIDLPGVGENHHDHFGASLSFESPSSFITPDKAVTDADFAAQQLQEYVQNRTGIYSATSATTIAYLSMQDFMSPGTAASLLNDLDAALRHQPSHLKSQFALQRKWLSDPTVPQVEFVLFSTLSEGVPEPGKSYYTISIFLQHLWSRGSVHITTPNPLAPPGIDGQYLNSPGDFDMKLLVEAVKWALKLSQTEPLKNATVAVLNLALNSSDAQIKDFITSSGNTEWHFAGTASMLPRDQNGVVDSHLKVYGTSNIRVVDASILPVDVAAHPTVTLYG
ncbi:hypothetical protein C0995_016197 [Termitomyces sp. Mi166|nr:hypothetical protein C0995_016197 [Termitomyces sp. Mi166\